MKDEEDDADACEGGRPGLQPPGQLGDGNSVTSSGGFSLIVT